MTFEEFDKYIKKLCNSTYYVIVMQKEDLKQLGLEYFFRYIIEKIETGYPLVKPEQIDLFISEGIIESDRAVMTPGEFEKFKKEGCLMLGFSYQMQSLEIFPYCPNQKYFYRPYWPYYLDDEDPEEWMSISWSNFSEKLFNIFVDYIEKQQQKILKLIEKGVNKNGRDEKI